MSKQNLLMDKVNLQSGARFKFSKPKAWNSGREVCVCVCELACDSVLA